jgi:hypothetical protein
MKLLKSHLILLTVSILTGCMGYRHSREVVGISKESTTLVTAFKKGEAAALASKVKDGSYSRSVGATSVKGSVDAKGVTAAGGAIGEAGKTFVKP